MLIALETGKSNRIIIYYVTSLSDPGRLVGVRKFYSWEYSPDEEGSIALEHASFPSPHRKSLESIRKPVVAQREQRFSDRYLVYRESPVYWTLFIALY